MRLDVLGGGMNKNKKYSINFFVNVANFPQNITYLKLLIITILWPSILFYPVYSASLGSITGNNKQCLNGGASRGVTDSATVGVSGSCSPWAEDQTYEPGQQVSYSDGSGKVFFYQVIQKHTAFKGAGWIPPATAALWAAIPFCGYVAAADGRCMDWLDGSFYVKDQLVVYKNKTYKATMNHNAWTNADASPENAHSLWMLGGTCIGELTSSHHSLQTEARSEPWRASEINSAQIPVQIFPALTLSQLGYADGMSNGHVTFYDNENGASNTQGVYAAQPVIPNVAINASSSGFISPVHGGEQIIFPDNVNCDNTDESPRIGDGVTSSVGTTGLGNKILNNPILAHDIQMVVHDVNKVIQDIKKIVNIQLSRSKGDNQAMGKSAATGRMITGEIVAPSLTRANVSTATSGGAAGINLEDANDGLFPQVKGILIDCRTLLEDMFAWLKDLFADGYGGV
jgi:hypothetical protein